MGGGGGGASGGGGGSGTAAAGYESGAAGSGGGGGSGGGHNGVDGQGGGHDGGKGEHAGSRYSPTLTPPPISSSPASGSAPIALCEPLASQPWRTLPHRLAACTKGSPGCVQPERSQTGTWQEEVGGRVVATAVTE